MDTVTQKLDKIVTKATNVGRLEAEADFAEAVAE